MMSTSTHMHASATETGAAASGGVAAPAVTRERPILFSAPMILALLSGAKTQTRRIVKFQRGVGGAPLLPLIGQKSAIYLTDDIAGCLSWIPVGGGPELPWPVERMSEVSPYGARGDRLWVRETFALSQHDPETSEPDTKNASDWDAPIYRADGDQGGEWTNAAGEPIKAPWKPSIFMPRWASRLTLEVTDVRVERLQSIDPEDAMREGVGELDFDEPLSSVEAFERLWTKINGSGSWEANPFCWAISFRVI